MREFEDATYDYGLDPGESFDPDELADEPFDLTQPHVMTALGPIDPDALGFTLPHEHVLRRPAAARTDPDLLLNDVGAAIAELEGFFAVGGRAVVDLTTIDSGRDIVAISWVAVQAPIHLILATGHESEATAPQTGNPDVDELAGQIVTELTVGIDGTAGNAGLIAAGTGPDEITEFEERALRAAARAHLATGAPISAHSERGTMAREQLAILRGEGVDPSRVILGGLDIGLGEETLRALLETGAFVALDQWARGDDGADRARAAMVKRLVDAGHGAQLLVSGGFDRRSSQLSYGGGPGFAYFVEQVPLVLMAAGLSAPEVRAIFIENPARALTVHPAES
jgi:phosphotriesterase-related protein